MSATKIGKWDFDLCQFNPTTRCSKDADYPDNQCAYCMVYWTYEEYARYEAALMDAGIVSLDVLHRAWHRFWDGRDYDPARVQCTRCE